METCIREGLQQGIIHPSTSLVSTGFFFVKKDGGLRPCIDYRALNAISVKDKNPTVAPTSTQLRRATVFTKLALCSTYNFV